MGTTSSQPKSFPTSTSQPQPQNQPKPTTGDKITTNSSTKQSLEVPPKDKTTLRSGKTFDATSPRQEKTKASPPPKNAGGFPAIGRLTLDARSMKKRKNKSYFGENEDCEEE